MALRIPSLGVARISQLVASANLKGPPTQAASFIFILRNTAPPTSGFCRAHYQTEDMSKLDFITYLKSTLTAASAKLLAASPTNRATAGRLDQIVRTADDNVSNGHWAQISPLYEPFAPKLQLAVMHLNADIISGLKSVPDFDTYFALIAAEVQN